MLCLLRKLSHFQQKKLLPIHIYNDDCHITHHRDLINKWWASARLSFSILILINSLCWVWSCLIVPVSSWVSESSLLILNMPIWLGNAFFFNWCMQRIILWYQIVVTILCPNKVLQTNERYIMHEKGKNETDNKYTSCEMIDDLCSEYARTWRNTWEYSDGLLVHM